MIYSITGKIWRTFVVSACACLVGLACAGCGGPTDEPSNTSNAVPAASAPPAAVIEQEQARQRAMEAAAKKQAQKANSN